MENTIEKSVLDILDDKKVGYVQTAPFEKLKLGWHKVVIAMIVLTNDFMAGLKEPTLKDKEDLPPWEDPTPQVAIVFKNKNNEGLTRRFALRGYWKQDDLVASGNEYAEMCIKAGDQGYAMDKADKVRMEHEDNTRKALFILKRCLAAAGASPDKTIGEVIRSKELIDKELLIEVTAHTYNGKTYEDVSNFAPVDTPEDVLKRIPRPSNALTELPVTSA